MKLAIRLFLIAVLATFFNLSPAYAGEGEGCHKDKKECHGKDGESKDGDKECDKGDKKDDDNKDDKKE